MIPGQYYHLNELDKLCVPNKEFEKQIISQKVHLNNPCVVLLL